MSTGFSSTLNSDEHHYPAHPSLLSLIERWDRELPGVAQAVIDDVRTGDWDAEDVDGVEEDDEPPYTVAYSFEVALEHFADAALLAQQQNDRKTGPWYVRWGLKSPSLDLNLAWKDRLARGKREAEAVLSRLPASLAASRYHGR